MNEQESFDGMSRSYRWGDAEYSNLSLPDFFYRPLPFAILLIIVLGIGSSFIGLLPGINTHEATLSGVGSPWVGIIVLLVILTVWYWYKLRHLYSTLVITIIAVSAVVVALLVNMLSLDVLVVEYPDAFIGGLGTGIIFIPLLLFTCMIVFEGFILSTFMGSFMGMFMGALVSFPIGLSAMFIMMIIYGAIGGLAGGIGDFLRFMFITYYRKLKKRM